MDPKAVDKELFEEKAQLSMIVEGASRCDMEIFDLFVDPAKTKEQCEARIAELEAIYNEHKWERCYLDLEPNGRIHSSSGRHDDSRTHHVYWWTDLSGMSQKELFKLHGDMCCTKCYPTAPADLHSKQLLVDKVRDWIKQDKMPPCLMQYQNFITNVYPMVDANKEADLVILVTGARAWTNYGKLKARIESLCKEAAAGTKVNWTVVHGGARGADTMADRAAKELGFKTISCPVPPILWKTVGNGAGVMRNQQMIDTYR